MTELLLHTTLAEDTQLQKISSYIYFDNKTKKVYKLAFLPHGVVFHNDTVMQPKVAALTKCDPYFLAINLLSKKAAEVKTIPKYLLNVKFQEIADETTINSEKGFTLNKTKVYDWLEKKVDKLHQCFQHFQDSNFKCQSSDKRYITSQMINILKCQIQNSSLVDEFARQRYSFSSLRKRMPEEQENDRVVSKSKPKPKKQTKKQEPRLPPSQKTLFGFIQKKKE